jgi:hypothetical protein
MCVQLFAYILNRQYPVHTLKEKNSADKEGTKIKVRQKNRFTDNAST